MSRWRQMTCSRRKDGRKWRRHDDELAVAICRIETFKGSPDCAYQPKVDLDTLRCSTNRSGGLSACVFDVGVPDPVTRKESDENIKSGISLELEVRTYRLYSFPNSQDYLREDRSFGLGMKSGCNFNHDSSMRVS